MNLNPIILRISSDWYVPSVSLGNAVAFLGFFRHLFVLFNFIVLVFRFCIGFIFILDYPQSAVENVSQDLVPLPVFDFVTTQTVTVLRCYVVVTFGFSVVGL